MDRGGRHAVIMEAFGYDWDQDAHEEVKLEDNELSPIVINEVPTTDEDGEEEES